MKKKNIIILVILAVFHTAGINEKKIYNYHEKKILVHNLGYCPSELKVGLGAGCWACRRWAGAGRSWGVRGQRWGALGWGAGRAQAGTAGVRGPWVWRVGRRAWARGQAQTGGSSARAQRARGKASGWCWRAGARGRLQRARGWADGR